MNQADIPYLSASRLSALIESREVSPVEATRAYLRRIDELDFKFNSYLTVTRKHALRQAEEAEREILGGRHRGPMHGVPVAVKDQLWTRGIRTTGGSRILADLVPEDDATVVANLKAAGAVVLGKTNLTEFAIGGPHSYANARNPWDLDTSAGSSSSGSGSATSAYLCATSLGEDTGGSIRFPASWCGIVGLRPTWGLVSRYGVMRGVWSMDQVGPISRTVEDAAITLGAIAGPDPKDPYTRDAAVPDYRRALGGGLKGMRIGLVTELTQGEVVDPEVREAVTRASTVLEELGASVEEVSIPLSAHATTIFWSHLSVEPASTHLQWLRDRLPEYGYSNRISLLMGSVMPAQSYYKAQKLRALLRREVHDALDRYDLLMSPTIGATAQRVEGTGAESARRRPYLLTFTFNLANCPAISVPCGFSSHGLPVGLQLGGRPFGEETILRAAHAYEQATPWHTMRPTYA
ncbi:MAG: amidase [Dehalococcoidia bacterium]|nr:amidase [Dehalococcoidia bacterium]